MPIALQFTRIESRFVVLLDPYLDFQILVKQEQELTQ